MVQHHFPSVEEHWRNCFLHFTIELFPVTLLENAKVNIWICWIIYKLCIVLFLKISKQMEQHVQMCLKWRWKESANWYDCGVACHED
jgi:hypothetical protein